MCQWRRSAIANYVEELFLQERLTIPYVSAERNEDLVREVQRLAHLKRDPEVAADASVRLHHSARNW